MDVAGKRGFLPWLICVLHDAAWAPIAVFTLHVVAARCFDVYDRFPHFDIPMHLLGGLAIAYWFHIGSLRALAYSVIGPYHRLTHCLLVFGLTCATAVFWEFAEYLADRYLGTRMQGGDLDDTLKDMLLGIVGCITWLAGTWVCGRLPPTRCLSVQHSRGHLAEEA